MRVPIDLNDPAVARDPYPHYERLRRDGAVQFLPHHNAWIALGYDEVQSVFARPNVFSNAPYAEVDSFLLGADAPAHTAVRRIVLRQFSVEAIEGLALFAERCATALLQPKMDAVRDYARPLSEAVAAELLGLDERHVESIHQAYARSKGLRDVTDTLDSIAERAAMYERLTADGLEDRQVRSLIRLLWLAATHTAERTISRCVLRLLQHDDVRRRVTDDLALVPNFVEEVLRLHPAELIIRRITTEATSVGNVTLPAGTLVYLSLAAANRDPAKFDAPAELRLDRTPARHFSFGHGVHHCVGATLGRREVEAAVRVLITRAPHFRAAGAAVVARGTMTENSIAELPVETGVAS